MFNMYIQNFYHKETDGNSYLHIITQSVEPITIKVLNTEGGIAKKINALVEQGEQILPLNLSDLTSGKYVLNAFCKGVFIKSIRFII